MLAQPETRARRQLAPAALALDGLRRHLLRIELLLRAALAARAVLPAIGAGGVHVLGADVAQRRGVGVGAGRAQAAAAAASAGGAAIYWLHCKLFV